MRGVDLRVEPGERVLLLGPSGSGKSTLLAALAGLLDPSHAGEQQGSARLDGVPAPAARARAGLVQQDPEAAIVMSRAGDDVAFGLENRGVAASQIWPRVHEALADVGFRQGAEASTAALSGGEQQRLALAGILALRPGLLLLDEVTANLDPAGAALVRGLLGDVLDATGATAVVVEHRVEQVVDLCTRAVVLEPGGGVVEDGPPAEVFARSGPALAARGVWVPGHHPAVRRAALAGRPVPTGSPELLLRATGVRFRYPGAAADALAPTDAAVRGGRALAVTGPNGSGKSTLALCLAGLLRPTAGSVTAGPALDPPRSRSRWRPTRNFHDREGIPALFRPDPPHDHGEGGGSGGGGGGGAGGGGAAAQGALPMWRWRGRDLVTRVGTVFQDPEHQFVTATVRDELTVGPRRAGASAAAAADRAAELLDRLGLSGLAEANPFTLSGGEKRRLSVATAIATGPRVLVADEPTFGQDALTWASLVELLDDLRGRGTALVLVTHDEPLVRALADVRLDLPDRPHAAASGPPTPGRTTPDP